MKRKSLQPSDKNILLIVFIKERGELQDVSFIHHEEKANKFLRTEKSQPFTDAAASNNVKYDPAIFRSSHIHLTSDKKMIMQQVILIKRLYIILLLQSVFPYICNTFLYSQKTFIFYV